MHDSIIFDLDGTLWDATETSAVGWNSALKAEGLSQYSVTSEDIKKICGLPFDECLSAVFGHFTGIDCKYLEPLIDDAEKSYLETEGGDVFIGVAKGIKDLSLRYPIFLISNCQSWYLQAFLKQFENGYLFADCDSFGDSGIPKSDMIKAMVRKHSLKKAIYIGDTDGDRQSSYDAKIDFGFVSYGFGKVQSSEVTFSSFKQLVNHFLEKD